jgi:hypothetical protein
MELCEQVIERGVFAQGIRPPTVPNDSARLRLAVMATHRPAELSRAAARIGEAAREVGIAYSPPVEAPWGAEVPVEMPEAA